MRLRDSGALTDAEFAALKAKLIHGQAQALTRGARSSVPAVAYPSDFRDHPETAERAYRLTRRPVSQEEGPMRDGSSRCCTWFFSYWRFGVCPTGGVRGSGCSSGSDGAVGFPILRRSRVRDSGSIAIVNAASD